MASDEEVARQILSVFTRHKVVSGGLLRRNHFIDVRDADFQRGLNSAVENHWLKINPRDRYHTNSPTLVLPQDWRPVLRPVL